MEENVDRIFQTMKSKKIFFFKHHEEEVKSHVLGAIYWRKKKKTRPRIVELDLTFPELCASCTVLTVHKWCITAGAMKAVAMHRKSTRLRNGGFWVPAKFFKTTFFLNM